MAYSMGEMKTLWNDVTLHWTGWPWPIPIASVLWTFLLLMLCHGTHRAILILHTKEEKLFGVQPKDDSTSTFCIIGVFVNAFRPASWIYYHRYVGYTLMVVVLENCSLLFCFSHCLYQLLLHFFSQKLICCTEHALLHSRYTHCCKNFLQPGFSIPFKSSSMFIWWLLFFHQDAAAVLVADALLFRLYVALQGSELYFDFRWICCISVLQFSVISTSITVSIILQT